MSQPRVAASLMPLENRREVLVSTAVAADRLGFDGYFLPETWVYDTTVVLAEAATKTERVTLGTGPVRESPERRSGAFPMAVPTGATIEP